MDGVRCVAVPVGRGREVGHAISLAGPAFRLTVALAERLVGELQQAAERIGMVLAVDQLAPPSGA